MKLTQKKIAVIDRGWVFVGDCSTTEDTLLIENAKCIRRWGTEQGLGELALKGPQPETKLDDSGVIRVPLKSLMFLMDTEDALWK